MISAKDAIEITKDCSKYDIIVNGIEDAIFEAAGDGQSSCCYTVGNFLLEKDIGMDETKLKKLITDMKTDGYEVELIDPEWGVPRYISISWNPDIKPRCKIYPLSATIIPFDDGTIPNPVILPKPHVGFWKRIWKLLIRKGECIMEKNIEKRIFVLRNKKSKYISLVVRLDKQTEPDPYKYNVELMVTSVNGWGGDDNIDDITEEMVGTATIKNGACSHWWFKGEGSIGANQDEMTSSYYHLCGFRGYDSMAMGTFFAYKVADKVIGDLEELDEYETKHMKIYEQLFEDFDIEEILDGHIPQEPSDF